MGFYEILVYIMAYIGLFVSSFYLLSMLSFYKKKEEKIDDKKRFVTIVIPAFNEEKSIGKTIESALNLDYPKDKFVFWYIFIVLYYFFITTPVKLDRYLFPLLLPLSFFFIVAYKKFNFSSLVNKFIPIFYIVIAIVYGVFDNNYYINPVQLIDMHIDAKQKLEELELLGYDTYSDSWVFLNYLHVNTNPSPWTMIDKKDESVYVHFINRNETNITVELKGYEKYQGDKFIIYSGDRLNYKEFNGDLTYLEWLEVNTGEEINYCESVFDINIFKNICLITEKDYWT